MFQQMFHRAPISIQLAKIICLTSVIFTVNAFSAKNIVVNVDDNQKFQEMSGVGASFTDSAAWIVSDSGGILSDSARQQLMKDLFDPVDGIGLSLLRQPMGTSDFRWADYTYNDLEQGQTDYSLQSFSIARDQSYTIPMIKEALAVNPNINVMALPWSAPAWMKDNNSLYQGSLIDSEQVYDTYAAYFVKFVQAYQQQGIDIYAVALQNEPQYTPSNYPSMAMTSSDQIRLAEKIGSQFESSNIETKIISYEHNWNDTSYPIEVLNNAAANAYLSGTSFHCYAGDVSAQTTVHNVHPDKDIYFTECTESATANFADDFPWAIENLVIGTTRNWSKTVVEWNIALGNYHGPKIDGGCSDCRGLVTVSWETGEVTKEPAYYALGHMSKFVQPGAHRVYSDHEDSVAFKDPEGNLTLIVINTQNGLNKTFDINWQGKTFEYTLTKNAVATFTWSSHDTSPQVNIWETTTDQTKLLAPQVPISFSDE